MAEAVATPEPYIAEDAPEETDQILNLVIDPLVNPEEAGEIPASLRPGTQERRRERWNRLERMHANLKPTLTDRESVLGLKVGYCNGVGDHPVGLAVALKLGPGTVGAGSLPEAMLDRTIQGDLRLVAEECGSMAPVRAVGFALPPISEAR